MPKKLTITPEPHRCCGTRRSQSSASGTTGAGLFSRQDGSESWSGPQRGDGLQFAAFVDCAPVIGPRAAKGLREHHDTSAVMLKRVYSAHIGDHADAGCIVGRLVQIDTTP